MVIFSSKKIVNKRRGFTLVELLVTITIFVMVTALVLIKYRGFNSTILLNNVAYNVALTIRDAQSYGINVQGSVQGINSGYNHAYGVHFDQSNAKKILLFVDANDNGTYDSTETILTYSLKNNNSISNLCSGAGSGNPPSCAATQLLDILFKRPSPAAIISNSKNYAKITISSIDGDSKSVVVWHTGQISVE